MPTVWPTNIKSFNDDLSATKLLEDDRLFIVQQCLKGQVPLRVLAEQWHLKRRTLSDWIVHHKNNKLLANPRGFPPKLPEEYHQRVRDFCNDKIKREGCSPSKDELKEEMLAVMKEAARKRGIGDITPPGENFKTIQRKKMKLGMKKVQAGFQARLAAEYDIKNCISTCVLFGAVLRFVPSAFLIVNYDATQFIISQNFGKKVDVAVDMTRKQVRDGRPIKGARSPHAEP